MGVRRASVELQGSKPRGGAMFDLTDRTALTTRTSATMAHQSEKKVQTR
jgi:hypothetical protein